MSEQSTTTRNLGYVPVGRGAWNAQTTYYPGNIVVNRGSTFMCATQGSNNEPIVTVGAGGSVTCTAGWIILCTADPAIQTALAAAAAAASIETRLLSGELIPVLAGDLAGNANTIESTDQYVVRTTAGDNSIDSSAPAKLLSIRGGINAAGPFRISGYKWLGFNLLNPNQSVGSSKYFQVPKCTRGNYGTAEENNGILFTDNQGNNLHPTVRFLAGYTAPTGENDGVALTPYRFDGHEEYFYAPSEPGFLIVQGLESPANVCAHVAWSKDYDKYVAYSDGYAINLYVSPLTSAFDTANSALILRGLADASRSVSDYITISGDVAGGTYGKMIGHVLLTSLTWRKDTEAVGQEGETTTVYVYSATLSAAATDGLIRMEQEGMTFEGNTLSYRTSDIATINGFKELIAGKYADYELATPVTGTHSITTQGKYADDMSLEVVLGGTNPAGYITTQYSMGYKDTVRYLPLLAEQEEKVTAHALCQLAGSISSLNALVQRLLPFLFEDMAEGKQIVLKGEGAPSITPDMPMQFYRDLTNAAVYVSVSNTSSSDWKLITPSV